MHLPDVPYMPLRLEKEEKEFLDSLEGKIDTVLVARREGEMFSVLGYNEGRMKFVPWEPYVEDRDVKEYVQAEVNRKTGEQTYEVSMGAFYYSGREEVLMLGTLMVYGLIRAFSPMQYERERRREVFYRRSKEYLTLNTTEVEEELKRILVYEGPLKDVMARLGVEVENITLPGVEQFISAKDIFQLRVEAARLGADAVIQYTPGSAIGTPVRFR